MVDITTPKTDTTSEALTALLQYHDLSPQTQAETFTLQAILENKTIWLGLENPDNQFEQTIIRPNFAQNVLAKIFQHRQNNQDITTLYEWTGQHSPFSPAETQLIEMAMSLDKALPFADQVRPTTLLPENNIRGPFLSLLLNALETVPSDPTKLSVPQKLTLSGATITGPLELTGNQRNLILHLTYCIFDSPLKLNQSHLTSLTLNGSLCPGIEAENITVKDKTNLTNGFQSTAPVSFARAHFYGPLSINDAKFFSTEGDHPVLSLQEAVCKSTIKFEGQSFVHGTINCKGITCHQDMNFTGLNITSNQPQNSALYFDNATLKADLDLGGNFSAIGTTLLKGTTIHGNFNAIGGTFQNLSTEGDRTTLQLQNCHLKNQINFQYANFLGPIAFENCSIGGDCDLSNIACSAQMKQGAISALRIENCDIASNLFLAQSVIKGQISLKHTKLANSFNCSFSALENVNVEHVGHTLNIEHVHIGYNLLLGNGFVSKGHVNINSSQINNDLICTGAHFQGQLEIKNTAIQGCLNLDHPSKPETKFENTLSLMGTHTHTLQDDKRSWPAHLNLTNFTFEHFAKDSPLSAQERLSWLARYNSNNTIAYTQTINAYTRKGKHHQASQIAHAKAHRDYWQTLKDNINRRNKHGIPPAPIIQKLRTVFLWPMHALTWLIYGGLWRYGYGITRLILITLFVIAMGGIVYQKAEHQNLFMPKAIELTLDEQFATCKPEKGGSWTKCELSQIPSFSPWLYSVDAALPWLNLQQTANWHPRESNFQLSLPTPSCLQWSNQCLKTKWSPIDLGKKSLRNITLTQTIFGWILSLGILLVIYKTAMLRQKTKA